MEHSLKATHKKCAQRLVVDSKSELLLMLLLVLQPSPNISHVMFSNQLWKFVELQPLSLCFFFSLGIQFKSLFSLIILPCFPLPYIRL